MRKLVLFITVMTCGLMVGGSSAAAAEPVIVEKHTTLTRNFAGLTDCQAYGFTTTEDYLVYRSVTDYYDNSGTLLREVIHARFVGTATNDATGKSIPVAGVRHIVLDFATGRFVETGVLRHVTMPGDGIVLHESGRIVTDLQTEALLFEAGPHQLFNGDLSAFCTALADA